MVLDRGTRRSGSCSGATRQSSAPNTRSAAERVIESGFYQRHFGDRFFLVSDQNVKTYYENSRRGYRISTSVGGTAIGCGGDCLVLDDPHNLKTIDSDTARTGALEFFRKVWSQRFNNAKRGHHVIVMQRGHEDDLANLVMERGGFEHLNLPSEYERTPFVIVSGEKITVDGFAGDVQERDEVIATAKRKRRKATIDDRVQVSAIGWQDPRDADGELLWPERFGQKEIDAAKRDLLETGFATQHQQRPVPQEGAMFKRSKFKVVTQAELTDLGTDYVEARGWDFAATEETPGTDPDYTVVSDFSANGPTRGSIFPVLDMAGKVLRPRKPNDPITDLTDLDLSPTTHKRYHQLRDRAAVYGPRYAHQPAHQAEDLGSRRAPRPEREHLHPPRCLAR